MIKALWNIGVKTADLEADLAFLEKVGATIVLRDVLPVDGADTMDYAIVRLGGVRLLLPRVPPRASWNGPSCRRPWQPWLRRPTRACRPIVRPWPR